MSELNLLWFAFLMVVISGASVVYGGSGFEVTCTTDKCGFNTRAGIGGGMRFALVSGYCTKCQKWISLSWGDKDKCPSQLARYWDPSIGKQFNLYSCPMCASAFVEIENIQQFKYCPRCNKPSLKGVMTVLYD